MRVVLALLLVLLSVSLDTHAARATDDRTVLDATILVIPGEVYRMCMDLPAGTLAATASLPVPDVTASPRRFEQPVSLGLFAYRGEPTTPGIDVMVTTAEATYVTPIIGGLYCLSLISRNAVQSGQSSMWQAQMVALKITIAPA